MQPAYLRAHTHSRLNQAALLASAACGCFHCQVIFLPTDITEWTDDGKTALCPHCGIDALIGSASGVTLSPRLLKRMQEHWFGVPDTLGHAGT